MMRRRDESKIRKMREAAKICSEIYKGISNLVEEGRSLKEIDNYAYKSAKNAGVEPAFLGYEDFPASICTSLNDVVVHGIPDNYKLKKSDVLGIDFGVKYKDVYSDMSMTFAVGAVSEEANRLIDVTKQATLAGIKHAKVGNTVGDIGNAMQTVIESNGFSVVKEFVGHGIGYSLHEEPYVPGYGEEGRGSELYDGQTLAIEAIVNEGKPDVYISAEDGWTSYTKDGKLSALFEHTVVVGKEPEILTKW
jgi:methionyl aminopeptidase